MAAGLVDGDDVDVTRRAPDAASWLVPFTIALLGTYVLLVALAVGEMSTARWGFWLVIGAVACFAIAAALAAREAKRLFRD